MYTGIKTPESVDIRLLGSSDLYQVCQFVSFFFTFNTGGGGGGGGGV